MNSTRAQDLFYELWRDFKDIDYGELLKFVNRFIKEDDRLDRSAIFGVIDHWATVGKYVT
jgi:hypothetical protein